MAAPWRPLTLALYGIPGLAVLIVALIALLGQTHSPTAARIYGGPPGPDKKLSWRVMVTERDRGLYAPVRGAPLRLVVGGDVAEGITDEEGAWEIQFTPSHVGPRPRVEVRAREGDLLLVGGEVSLAPEIWRRTFKRISPRVAGNRTGNLLITVHLMRGTLAASYPEQLRVSVTKKDPPDPVPDVKLTVGGDGFVAEPSEITTDLRGQAELTVRTRHHAPRMEVSAESRSGEKGTWETVLAVVPGAMWIDDDARRNGELVVRSPVRHRGAYITIFSETARLWAGRLPLSPDRTSGAVGRIALPERATAESWILVSPDPHGQGQEGELAAWPLSDAGHPPEPRAAAQMRTPLLLDGMPVARAALGRHVKSVRLAALLVLLLASIVEAGLLYLRSREAKRELEALLASHADIDEAMANAIAGGQGFWLKLVVATFLVAVGFAGLALVLWFKG